MNQEDRFECRTSNGTQSCMTVFVFWLSSDDNTISYKEKPVEAESTCHFNRSKCERMIKREGWFAIAPFVTFSAELLAVLACSGEMPRKRENGSVVRICLDWDQGYVQ